MPARVRVLWFALVATGLTVTACGTPKGPAPPPTIGLLATTAGFGDHSYNDAARAALETCRQEVLVQLASAAPVNTADIEPKLILDATVKDDTVITLGYPAAAPLDVVARRFESTHFAIVDAVVREPNVESVTFDESQGAFLAGALAASVSRTHRVAFIGGANVALLRRSAAGFAAGARAVDPRVSVTARYTGSFERTELARAAATALLAGGNDVAYVIDGPAGLDALRTFAAAPHAFAIGADSDQNALVPGKILASVVKNVGAAVLRICLETAGGKPESGHRVLGVAGNGIVLALSDAARPVVGDATRARLARLQAGLATGRIRIATQP